MIYLIENKHTNFGDWSDILWAGFATYEEESNLVYIERSGPFVPAIYEINGNLIFTEKAKESYNFNFPNSSIFSYKVEKRKIVNIDWKSWNEDEFYENIIEDSLEPESVIENSLHDQEVALLMEDLWLAETFQSLHLFIEKHSKSENPSDYIFTKNLPHQEWYIAKGIEYNGYFVTAEVKEWLDNNFPECFEIYLISEF